MSIKIIFVFFFKQKTAYEIMPSLVGSEMCIRDRCDSKIRIIKRFTYQPPLILQWSFQIMYLIFLINYSSIKIRCILNYTCLLYTSDAADDMQCVDLGGFRNNKKRTDQNKAVTKNT
eukprot:TRINITY_DN38226_c0_g1_i1.p1 TRINITY_DN38226_c0_g1~~TRINITY_DN38226_c0_g1_i1.p1  ORF type:complete len:117 (-),score=19.80 TRINITY_DN38226_c0_g1_i1:67-417(-)